MEDGERRPREERDTRGSVDGRREEESESGREKKEERATERVRVGVGERGRGQKSRQQVREE